MERLVLYAAIMLCASTAPSKALNAPSNPKATPISSSRINLKWTDNSDFEDGFTIQRSTEGTNFTFLTSVGSNVTSCGNTGLEPGRTYWYRVRAFRNSGKVSAWSNMADATTFPAPTSTKKIIHWQAGAGGHGTLPSHILANLAWIDALPFDGLVFYNDASYTLLAPGNVATSSNLYNTWFAPIKGKLKNVTHNYQTVFCRRSADVFDDWTQVIANWTAMTQAARDGGFDGLFFDNECYYESVWNYPRDMKYGGSKTINQYQEQFRLRGQQVMQAILAQWPSAKVIHAHSPYVSVSQTPGYLSSDDSNCKPSDMRGWFFAGMLAVAGPGQVIDGGENYTLRGSNYADSRQWRRVSIPNLTPNDLVPTSLKNKWLNNSSISFGIYDLQYYSGPVMNPTVFTQSIVSGVNQADELLWTYSEGRDFLTPGGVTKDWLDAVRNARSQLGLAPP